MLLLLTACDSGPSLQRLESDAVLAFGDSLTYGTGAGSSNSYPVVLSNISGRTVINAGVPGEMSSQGLQRLSPVLDQFKPQLVILCHGGNDILRKKDRTILADNLMAMIQLARQHGAEVVLLGVPQFGLFLSAAEEYRLVAKRSAVVFAENILPDILGDKTLKADAVHPNQAGYREMAQQIYEVIRNAGALE